MDLTSYLSSLYNSSMSILLTEKQLKSHKGDVPFSCASCKKIFFKSKSEARRVLKGTRKGLYCGNECKFTHQKKKRLEEFISYKCATCNTIFTRSPFDKRKNAKNHYCTRACSIQGLALNKSSYSSKRSKLEIHLEKLIKSTFPELEFKLNDRDAIGLELDFYFPTLKFAIELNGIVHYEPIYGTNKFNKIIERDGRKLIESYNKGIELCVIKDSGKKKEIQEIETSVISILNKIKSRENWSVV